MSKLLSIESYAIWKDLSGSYVGRLIRQGRIKTLIVTPHTLIPVTDEEFAEAMKAREIRKFRK